MTAALSGGALCLALVGCAGAGAEGPEPVALDPATGAVLADAADRLATALGADDPCQALYEADALRDRAAAALEDGAAPESVVAETTRVVDATTAGLSCDEGVEPEALDPDEDTADAGSADTADEQPAPADAGSGPTSGSDPSGSSGSSGGSGSGSGSNGSGSGSSGSSGSPGGGGPGASDGRGPDGQGPPGLRDGSGGGPPGRGRG